ncbi:MAG: ABC transporter ATP-binding protein, partial [Planctomycetes bacterium]|nr:ABC transporter ATP-binding protein [Planctomycetota bacterium]
VVDCLTLRVKPGLVYGFLGRNGAGKTTTIKMLLGLLAPTRGAARLLGCPSAELTPEVKARIGYLVEGHPLYGWMTVRGIGRFVASFYPNWNAGLFNDLLDAFQVPWKQKVGTLSKGQRAQVSLALTLAPEPELLIMDDPTLGLDPAVRRDFLESIVRVIQRKGRTVFFSSHILSDVERVADRIAVIEDGILLADCPTDMFHERVKKVRAAFDKTPPALDLPRTVNRTLEGNDLYVTVVDYGEEQERLLRHAGAREVEIIPLGLEDLFIEYTARRGPARPIKSVSL